MKRYMVKVDNRSSGLGYVEAADAASAAESLRESVMEMQGFYLHIEDVPMNAPRAIDWQGLWAALPNNHTYAGVARQVLSRVVIGPTAGNYLEETTRRIQTYIRNGGPGSSSYEGPNNADRAAYWFYWACHTDLRMQAALNKHQSLLADAGRLGVDVVYAKAQAFDRLAALEAYDRDGGWSNDEGETVPRSEVLGAWESAKEEVATLQARVSTLNAEAQSLWDELEKGELRELAQAYERAARQHLA